ncbi:MAG: hypothetical protein ACYC61_00040 [Isosphaeraceae bacterium]
MTEPDRPRYRWLLAAMVLAVVGSASVVRAQQIDDEDEEEAPVAQAGMVRMNAIIMNDAQFDQWVFGNMGVANPGAARNKLDSMLTLNIEGLDRVCGLTPFQKKKLTLAGHGDIKRFFDRIADLRKKFTKDRNDQNAWQKLWQEVQPLRNSFNSGFFEGDSIYAKAIKATLSPEQTARHKQLLLERTHYRYWAKVDLAMELLNNEVGFTDDQRLQTLKLLKEETKPPLKLGENDYYVVLYQLSRIPEARLKPVFEDVQWNYLKRQLDQGRGMAMFLKQNGFIPDEKDGKALSPVGERMKVLRKGAVLKK